MTTGILLVARLGSSRLPQKHLVEANNVPFIDHLLGRIYHLFADQINKGEVKLIIATSDEPENRKFEEHTERFKAAVFYGNKNNIPERQLACAEFYGLDNIISIDGDDILCSPEGMLKVYHQLIKGDVAVKTKGLPLGMNVMGYSTAFLSTSLRNLSDMSLLETGWGRIFDYDQFTVIDMKLSEDEKLRFTLDYPEDALFFQSVIHHFKEDIAKVTDKTIIDCVVNNHLYEINASLNDVYWTNFKTQMNKENE